MAVSGLNSGVTAIAAGQEHSLAVQNGAVYAWGGNTYGQLGSGNTTDSSVPVRVPGLSNIVAIAASNWDSFALAANGTLWAWGDKDLGELGDGATSDQFSPVQVLAPFGYRFTSIEAGGDHVIAAVAPVPEPASLAMLALAAPALLTRRRRRRA